MVFEHARHMQVLNGYQGVVFAEVAREFVGSVTADTGHLGMLLCQALADLFAVLTAYFAAGFLAFQASEALLRMVQRVWVRKGGTIRERGKRLNAQVYPDSRRSGRNGLVLLYYYLKTDKPATRFLRDRGREHLGISRKEITLVQAETAQAWQLHGIREDFDGTGQAK